MDEQQSHEEVPRVAVSRTRRIFRSNTGNIRNFWAVLFVVLSIGLIANPLVLLLDMTQIPALENSLKNVCIAIAAAIGVWTVLRFDNSSWPDVGIKYDSITPYHFLTGIAVGGGLIVLFALISLVFNGYQYDYSPQTVFKNVTPGIALLGQAIRYMSGSFFEELISRGFVFYLVYRSLPNRSVFFRNATALVISSVLFGLLHIGNSDLNLIAIVNLIGLGALFGLLYLQSQNLFAPVAAHFAWNFFQNSVFGMPNGGQASKAWLFESTCLSESAIFGGTVGPEGSFILTGLFLVFVPPLSLLATRRHLPIDSCPLRDEICE